MDLSWTGVKLSFCPFVFFCDCICADVWLYRCAVSGGVESECADSSGGGGKGTAALEGRRRSQRPPAQRLRLSGVAVLPQPRALLPHVRSTIHAVTANKVEMQDLLVLLDRSKMRSSQERSVGKVAFFCYCCLRCTPGGGSIVHTFDCSRMTLSSGSCSEQGVIAAVTVRALFHSVCLCSAAARAAPFAHAQNTQIGFLLFFVDIWTINTLIKFSRFFVLCCL